MSKKRKKNGFTTIELITTFGLVMTITILLFELVVSLKETYVNVAMRSLLLNKQAIMEQKIYDDFNYKKIKIASKCGKNCLTFFFEDNSQATLKIDTDTNIFTYGDYTIKLDDNTYFGDIEVTNKTLPGVAEDKNDSMIIIDIPIKNNLLDDDYGISAVYQYNSRETSISDIAFDDSSIDAKIFLKGSSEMKVAKGYTFDDPGYYTLVAGEITDNDSRVVVNSTINIETPGNYEITYELYVSGELMETKVRKVTVFETVTDFAYTGSEQTFTVMLDGYYKLEVWGSAGSGGSNGGYSTGKIYLTKGTILYIYCGGIRFNGGGTGGLGGRHGGGATHIATKSGTLNTLGNFKDSILIVAGGGGGQGENGIGGSGGGTSGQNGRTSAGYGTGGTQTSGGSYGSGNLGSGSSGSFGQGGNGNSAGNCGGGGGGYYGGGGGGRWDTAATGKRDGSGGGGSGYIGNSNLFDKHMTCYNCTTSTSENTYTISNTLSSSDPISDYSKQGNGYAIITYLGTSE